MNNKELVEAIRKLIDEFCEEKELVLNYKLKWFYDWVGGDEPSMKFEEKEEDD